MPNEDIFENKLPDEDVEELVKNACYNTIVDDFDGYKIGAAAEKLGITIPVLRNYTDKFIDFLDVKKDSGNKNAQRRYTNKDLEILKQIITICNDKNYNLTKDRLLTILQKEREALDKTGCKLEEKLLLSPRQQAFIDTLDNHLKQALDAYTSKTLMQITKDNQDNLKAIDEFKDEILCEISKKNDELIALQEKCNTLTEENSKLTSELIETKSKKGLFRFLK